MTKQLPDGFEWPRFEDGAFAKPGDVMCPHSFWENEEIESIIFDDEGAGVKTTSGNYWYAHDGEKLKCLPVLDKDGQEIKVGDTVYGQYGEKFKVDGFDYQSAKIVKVIDEKRFIHRYVPKGLTHERPDSWEKLEEDARRDSYDYWGCRGLHCGECPALIDGEKPLEHYHCVACRKAQLLDILRRAKALAGEDDE